MFNITQITKFVHPMIFIKSFSTTVYSANINHFFNLKQLNTNQYNCKTQFLMCIIIFSKRFILYKYDKSSL